tara:strand:+ start:279 stop:479 length:201 start_codon:yes stop_codon:yes gene_type:complete
MSKESAEAALNELVNSGKVYPEDVAPVREYISSLENPPKPEPKPAPKPEPKPAPFPANKAKRVGRK